MRKELLVFVLALLLILTSCDEKQVSVSNKKSFIGGTTGLLVSFVEGEPPSEVTDGGATPFTVSVKLENQGETYVAAEDIDLELKGIDAASFGLGSSADLLVKPLEDLLENDINPDTGETITSPPVYVTFPEMNFLGELSGNSAFPFVIDICYKYRTMATSVLCIKEDILDSTNTDVCTVTGSKPIENSGAPVQITSFEEFSAGQSAVSFSFKVKNVGNGLLSELGSGCDDTPAAENYVKVTVDTGIPNLVCSGLSDATQSGTAYTGKVKLATGERQIRCTQQLSESDKTDKIMIVDLGVEYDYQVSSQTSVLVKHI